MGGKYPRFLSKRLCGAQLVLCGYEYDFRIIDTHMKTNVHIYGIWNTLGLCALDNREDVNMEMIYVL